MLFAVSNAVAGGLNLPPSISTYGVEVDRLYYVILYITGFFFILTEAALIAFMLMFRAGRKNAKVRGDVHGNHTLEIVWTTIPALILVVLALMGQRTWAEIRSPSSIPADAIPIQVSARQFAWDIRYAGKDGKFGKTASKLITEDNPFGIDPDDSSGKDDVVMDSQMCVPVNKPVKVSIMSKDVIHSFFLPSVRIKQDAVPGMIIDVWFQATKTTEQGRNEWKSTKVRTMSLNEVKSISHSGRTLMSAETYKDKSGTSIVDKDGLILEDFVQQLKDAGLQEIKVYPEFDYQIVCAELCGNSHFKMKGTLLVESQEGYNKFLEDNAPQ
jgi:heme/copper-type cytochrome/quinol oxidase subunit 2